MKIFVHMNWLWYVVISIKFKRITQAWFVRPLLLCQYISDSSLIYESIHTCELNYTECLNEDAAQRLRNEMFFFFFLIVCKLEVWSFLYYVHISLHKLPSWISHAVLQPGVVFTYRRYLANARPHIRVSPETRTQTIDNSLLDVPITLFFQSFQQSEKQKRTHEIAQANTLARFNGSGI